MNKAYELGFCAIGFAKAEVLFNESEHLTKWLNEGYEADMSWIRKGFDKRKNIKLISENAASVISLAYNYYNPVEYNDESPKISKYAQGKDYHTVLKNKLKVLTEFINTIREDTETRYYVDDGPVMEKTWAVKAGIGWQGKHSNIINPDFGSWIFLCEIITNLEFEVYNESIEDLCGNCRICIDACPTNAITEYYSVDSNRCISYHTIENRSSLPDHLNFDGWIFGCDICQDVCPFNKNDKITKELSFITNKEELNRSIDELCNITEVQFKEIFKDSPIKRIKYYGLMRNLQKFKSDRS